MDAVEGNDYSRLPQLELYIEIAPGESCFGHIPALPGLCFRAAAPPELEQRTPVYLHDYINWLIIEKLADLNTLVAILAGWSSSADIYQAPVVLKEIKHGSPVWISGNPAALFTFDLYPLDDPAVYAHLRFTRHVLRRVSSIIEPIQESLRAQKPDSEHRSINEMLTHIGNCVWWYCSRIDDELPEPDEPAHEAPLKRIERLLDQAERYLSRVPASERNIVHIPARFKTIDPNEQWTHTKVCRRQAEHMWEHLSELQEIVGKEDEQLTGRLNNPDIPS